jgi:hypothetical protein
MENNLCMLTSKSGEYLKHKKKFNKGYEIQDKMKFYFPFILFI